jgi:hypothetical protein
MASGLRCGWLRVHGRSMLHIRLWQWPNLLAVDAALIALVWQAAFAAALGNEVSAAAQTVLGLSVCLTYMADRLFDVAKRPLQQLHSTRHQFAKQHRNTLWRCWWCVLLSNIGIAFAGLTSTQLKNGTALLTLCLIYTALNQRLSRRFFPKEFCVALIYTAGVIIFLLPNASLWTPACALTLLCLTNCLMIGAKEQCIDTALQVHSLSRLPTLCITTLKITCALSLCFLDHAWLFQIGLSLGALWIIHSCQERLSVETFRVLTDSALLIGPSVAFCLQL